MLKKTITYTDFNGDEVSEDYFFHLSKAELIELEMSQKGGLSEALQKIVASEDGKAIIREFKNIILTSYGQRSEDGKRFIKNQALRDEFESSEAYSALFVEIVMDADVATEFVTGIIPQDMAQEAAKVIEEAPAAHALSEVPKQTPPSVSRGDLMVMSKEDFAHTQKRIAEGEVELTP